MATTSLTGDVAAVQQVQLLQLRCARRPGPRSERVCQRVQACCATSPSCAALCRTCTCSAQYLVGVKHLVGLETSGNRISHDVACLFSTKLTSQSRAESWDVFAKVLWGKHLSQRAATDTVASERLSDAVELEEKCSSQSSKLGFCSFSCTSEELGL